jgi:outer membrane putative beta-barrel porin/alpha-amylase
MEPRAYSASPVGLNFFGVGYNWLTGDVVSDPALLLSEVQANVRSLSVGVGHTFNLLGDLGLVTATAPYSRAVVTGKIFEQQAEATRTGLSNAVFKMSVNLRGNPAMSPQEFKAAPQRVIVGASFTAVAPIGQYSNTKLINLGTNRWSLKPEMGVGYPKGPWDFDAYVGTWFFTANREFFPGDSTRTEDPVLTAQGHVSYEFRPRFWVALNGTWYWGGKARVDAGDASAGLNNTRGGITVSIPVARSSVKIAYSSGLTVRAGGAFRSLTVAWQMSWLSARWSGR